MRKLYFLAVFSIFLNSYVHAQQPCDSINLPVDPLWHSSSYQAPTPFPGYYGGYVNGVNWTLDRQKANYFDLSATSYNYIYGTLIKFGKANSTSVDSLKKIVYFKVYADNAGVPGSLLATAQKPLSEIKTDVDKGLYTTVNFPSAVALPSGKKFYVAVDVSNFQWDLGGGRNAVRDSIYISGTDDDQTINSAWELEKDSSWVAYPDNWTNPNDANNPLNISLWIFPYVGTSASGCALLPVQLLSFNAERKAADVQLKWQISSEINMKGYEIERANNNGIYKTVGFVAAVNNLKNQQYTLTDRNAFTASTAVQYRLKQIDNDGSIKYSRIITIALNNSITDAVFANPFTGTLKLQLNLSEPQNVSVKMYDMQGRTVAMQNPSLYSASANMINVNASSGLKPGAYLLEINTATEHKVYKVVKQ